MIGSIPGPCTQFRKLVGGANYRTIGALNCPPLSVTYDVISNKMADAGGARRYHGGESSSHRNL